MKGKNSMPNDSKGYGPGSGKNGSNHGASTGLKKAPADGPKGGMKPVSNKNPYPNGIA
jgi:hypothetical protein